MQSLEIKWLPNFRLAPGAEVNGVERDAKHVRWNEAELRCAISDEANDDAIDGRHNPSLPITSPHKNGRNNGKHAR